MMALSVSQHATGLIGLVPLAAYTAEISPSFIFCEPYDQGHETALIDQCYAISQISVCSRVCLLIILYHLLDFTSSPLIESCRSMKVSITALPHGYFDIIRSSFHRIFSLQLFKNHECVKNLKFDGKELVVNCTRSLPLITQNENLRLSESTTLIFIKQCPSLGIFGFRLCHDTSESELQQGTKLDSIVSTAVLLASSTPHHPLTRVWQY